MDANTIWIRIFDHGLSALAFSTITVVSGWLASRKYVGHRRVLVITCLFSLVRSVLHVYLAESTYTASANRAEVTALLTISCLIGLTMAVIVMLSANDMLRTLTMTEVDEVLRQDQIQGVHSRMALYVHMAEENKHNSVNLLSAVSGKIATHAAAESTKAVSTEEGTRYGG